mmetsp:Transcript_4381/g.6677  ORF Transcript_4381/g.6677 Transcript_4381/m.6677 type:complete len:343 (-) Transcript_4381:243-1271(-)
MARRFVGRAMGAVVSPIIEAVDVDGVVRRIDVEDIVERIDINELLARVDIDAVLERVDLNRQIERVDVNAIMDKVDINSLIERSNLKRIIARSSSGICGTMLDLCRNQIGVLDQMVQQIGRCRCIFSRHKPPMLPPRPTSQTKKHPQKDTPCPSPSQMGLALQGRFAGFLPRFLANLIDTTLVVTCLVIFEQFLLIISDFYNFEMSDKVQTWVSLAVALVFGLSYEIICVGSTGRTLGLLILGLRVVDSNTGRPVSFVRVVLRACLKPLTNVLLIGVFLSLVRRDGNFLHDLIMRTGMIYDWDAKYALLRQEPDETLQGISNGTDFDVEDVDIQDEEAQHEE